MCHLRHKFRIFWFHRKVIFRSQDIQVFAFRVPISFSMLYCEKLYDKNFARFSVISKATMILPDGQKILCFISCRLLENVISNVNLTYLEAPKKPQLRMKNVSRTRNT